MSERAGRIRAILGLDTSYYTTSVALVDATGARLADARRPVTVPAGERGLAQSEAVFRHLLSLPEVVEQAIEGAVEAAGRPVRVAAVAATVAPRPEMGSYMPVFKVAEGFGRSLAAILGVPMVPVTHQEGHLRAGLETSGAGQVLAAGRRLLALHLSGGTSELLLLEPLMGARRGRKRPLFEVTLLGGTIDLHAGQFLDHLGVHMGLPFPAGPHLEQLAEQGDGENGGGGGRAAEDVRAAENGRGPVTLPVSGGRRDERYYFSLSGPLSAAYRALAGGAAPADVAAAAQRTLAKALEKMVRPAIEATGIRDVLVAGGVASNRYLRGRLAERLGHRAVGGRLYFPEPALCVDNAVGVAWQGAAVARP